MLRFSSRTVHCWWWLLLSTSLVSGFNVLDHRCVSTKSILSCISFTVFPRCITNLSEKAWTWSSVSILFPFFPFTLCSQTLLPPSLLQFSLSCFLTNLLFPLFLCYSPFSARCPPQTWFLSSSHSRACPSRALSPLSLPLRSEVKIEWEWTSPVELPLEISKVFAVIN